MSDKATIADAIDIEALMRSATSKAEKASKLTPVFLKRDSFAKTAVSTGSLCLDWKMGGGIPPGRIIGISGPERSGKTLLTTQILFNQLRGNNFAVLHDAEGSTDPLFLQARKINFDKFRGKRDKNGDLKAKEVDYFNMYQPTTIEQFTEYIHTLCSVLPENRNPTHPVCIHSLDSVIALITDALDEDIDANKMAFHARMYAQYLPIINSDIVKTGCSLIYTNQLRQKPGVTYGSPIYEPAGDALKFFSSIRLMLSTVKPKLSDNDHPFLSPETIPGVEVKAGGIYEEPHLNSKGDVIGVDKYMYTGIKTVKNKVYTPYQSCWMRIQFEENGSTGSGLDPVFDIFTFFYETGYIKPCVIVNSATGKEKKSKGVYSAVVTKEFNPVKEFNLPESFDYYEFKKWVHSDPDMTMKLRDRLLVSGLVYEKEPDELVEEIDDEVLEEAALDEVAQGLEEIKKRGRPKKA
jgi:RecA/RadA recombinase